MKSPLPWLPALAAAGLLAGCASSPSASSRPVYSAGDVGQVLSSESGLVTQVEEVMIQASTDYPGAPGSGSQVGRAVGRSVLSTNPAAAAVGAIGGIMGAKAGATMDNKIGDKITITLDSGKTVTIVQPRDTAQPIMPGERVVIESGSAGKAKVVREAPSKDSDYAIKTNSRW